MKSFLIKNRGILAILLIGFVLRLVAIGVGYHGDLNNNISWAKLAFERGLVGYYESGNWPFSAPNQPPLTILLFYTVSFIWNHLNNFFWVMNNNIGLFPSGFIWFWEKWGMITLIKLPSIAADLGIGWLIYSFTSRISNIGYRISKKPIFLTCLWLFNPITWYNSAVWGQTDPIVNLLGLIAILYFFNNNIVRLSLFLTLSVLFKGSLLIFVPIIVVLVFIREKNIKVILKAVFVSFLTVVIASVWFHPNLNLLGWLLNLYKEKILPGEIGYLTANAFNFWWLIDPGKVLDSQKFILLPYRTWGFIIFAGFYMLLSFKVLRNKSEKYVLYTLAMIAFTSFMFMTRMHERYLYPFFPIATLLLYYFPKIWPLYLMVSATFLLNMFNLFWIPEVQLVRFILENPITPQIISILNILIFGILVCILVLLNNSSSKKAGKS